MTIGICELEDKLHYIINNTHQEEERIEAEDMLTNLNKYIELENFQIMLERHYYSNQDRKIKYLTDKINTDVVSLISTLDYARKTLKKELGLR